MNITGNLGLTIWDNIDDDFDYGQLEDNWIALDQHDHSPERGVQIPTAGLMDQAVTGTKVAPLAIANQHLQSSSVTTDKIGSRQVQNSNIEENSITADLVESLTLTFEQMDPNVIPLGTVTMWYRPPSSAAVPGGVWEIMDGRPWSSITNSWGVSSGNIPNMINRFPMGTTPTSGVGIGNLGGGSSVSLAHLHNVSAHDHSVQSHTHGINADGVHAHTFGGGYHIWTRQNAVPALTVSLTNAQGQAIPINSFTTYLKGGPPPIPYGGQAWDLPADMDSAGSHEHGGITQYSYQFETGVNTATTDVQLGTVDVTNPYVGLCYIMKCRNW